MDTQDKVNNQPAAPATDAQAKAPELTISDLQNIRTLIDVASRRGAFGAAEMSSVGATFDRLNTFLNSVAPPQQGAPGAPDAGQQPPSA
jgi:hypothetical protein